MSNNKKGLTNKQKIGIATAFLIVAFVVSFASIAFVMGQRRLQQDNVTEDIKEKVVDESKDIPIDFEEARKENSDIYAWIRIDGTNIDYPVLQNEDADSDYDEFYLDHLVDRSESYIGAIFSQKINSTDFSDYITVLYGHNLRNGEMFTHLHDYEDEDFMKENKTVYIYTPDEIFEYEIFAATPFGDQHIKYTYDDNRKGSQAFVDEVMESGGVYNDDIKVSSDDKLLVLSTCMSGNRSDERYIVVARLVNDDED